jgi:thioredoxin 1
MLPTTHCIRFTDDNFQTQVLESQVPVLVDCWASWCSSFQQINLVFEQLAIAFSGQIKIGRLNVATSEKLADYYGIRAVPMLLIFKEGQIVERIIGSVSQKEISRKIIALTISSYTHWSQAISL